ncbi:hypothetical protein F8388_006987 [Cannabis sativa]|uniref:DNA polymerase kappa n=1 Tax=Cannabis sativa TaxID=3483 RepID=A0A7J6F3Z1_CANSA|nr:hypothetical protein F8388_006987 [Cannabis sativa]
MEKGETSTSDTDRPWQSYHTVYTNAKAGKSSSSNLAAYLKSSTNYLIIVETRVLHVVNHIVPVQLIWLILGMDGVDKEKVQRVVYEMSKGSKYFENEERKEAFIRQKIENMRVRCAKLSAEDISHFQMVAEKRILELEAARILSRIWIHVDMDAFYAAVETLSNPSLKGKPMAVGSMSMISTANYEARKFGVRAAMPGFIARKLCPELIFAPTDFKKYNYYSDLTRKVFQTYDPNYMAAGLDEAYLDVTEACKERGITGEEIAKEIRTNIYEETGLTCSAGVAANRLLAKVCSDINKPNGQFVLPNNRVAVMTFISSLPIRKIGGIGKVTEHILRDALGISTCEEMLQKGSYICALFSQSTADFFLSVGLGLGGTDTPEVRLRKSISNERTFSATGDETLLYRKLEELSEMLSADMQKEGLCGRTLTLKLKTAAFELRTRAVSLQKHICSSEDILKHASKLLKAEFPISLRLIAQMDHSLSSDVTAYKVEGTSCPNRVTNGVNFTAAEAEVVSSMGQRELFLWVNDYKCSICGIEMPPDFIEERQEHCDFHLAEKLQKEESGTGFRSSTLRHRDEQKGQSSSQSQRKKRKLSPKEGRHIPIDVFFVKSNQNF